MSLNDSKYNNFYNTSKGKITSFISGIQYSPNNQPFLTFQNPMINLRKTKLNNLDNSTPVDLYRSDYILKKRNNTSYIEDSSKNLLGNKMNRTSENNNKVKIPSDNRYHKSLLQTSLEKIRSEIRQKRLENSNRLNEINLRADNLNDFFKNKNNAGKYTGIFNDNEKVINIDISNINIELKEKEDNKKIRKFDNDLICFNIHDSFSINSNKKKKLDPVFVEQRQSEFAYNNKNSNINKENKNENLNKDEKSKNKKEEIKSDKKVLFGAPKEVAKVEPLSKNITFGVKTKIEESKINENKNKDNTLNQKDASGATKIEVKSAPLLNKVTFGCSKTEVTSAPLSSNVTFGFVSKEATKMEEKNDNKNNSIFGPPKDNNLFGEKKEENKKRESLFKGNPFINNNEEKNIKNPFLINVKKEENKKTESLFKSNDNTSNIFNKKNKEDDLTESNKNKKKKIEENNTTSLFGEKKPNLFTNTEKETKTVSINAVNTAGSLFGNDNNKSTNLFGGFIPKKEETKPEEKKNLFAPKVGLFSGNSDVKSIFGNTNEKKDENNKSLFGNSENKSVGLFESGNKEPVKVNLFGASNLFFNNKNDDNIKDKKGGLFGDTGIFSKKENNDNQKSLFGNIPLFMNNNDNKNSLFINKDSSNNNPNSSSNDKDGKGENKPSLFGNTGSNDTKSLFGTGSNDTKSLFGNTNNNDNKSLFGNGGNNDNKSLFGNVGNNDNKTSSLFGKTIKFNFGK